MYCYNVSDKKRWWRVMDLSAIIYNRLSEAILFFFLWRTYIIILFTPLTMCIIIINYYYAAADAIQSESSFCRQQLALILDIYFLWLAHKRRMGAGSEKRKKKKQNKTRVCNLGTIHFEDRHVHFSPSLSLSLSLFLALFRVFLFLCYSFAFLLAFGGLLRRHGRVPVWPVSARSSWGQPALIAY